MHLKKNVIAASLALGLSALVAGCGGSSNNNDDDNSSTPPPVVQQSFNRVASFLVCSQVGSSCASDATTSAEIVAASTDGNTLIYTNSPLETLGFVDITNPAAPVALGQVVLPGEPTSVAVVGGNAVVGVNTSTDFVNVSGLLMVFDIATQTLLGSVDLPGQPDSVATSKDGQFIAVAIENERDEDLGDGAPPQMPAGTLVIIDVATLSVRTVDLTAAAIAANRFPTDPEPEYVDINDNNQAVLTLQENNHIMIIDLASGTVTASFPAGATTITQVDLEEEDPAIISPTQTATDVLREPDGVTWLTNEYFATADEGDLDGGSRGFTVYDTAGNVRYDAGNLLEHEAIRLGHYPDSRSGNKGNETENAEYGQFGDRKYLFLCSERSSLVYVFDVADPIAPVHLQTLPAAVGPEGVLAIPSRNLLIAASEEDSRGDVIRSALNIYQLADGAPQYPTLRSANRADGAPIPWGAMSGLAADPADATRVYAIEDSYYGANRIFGISTATRPAVLDREIRITDSAGVFAALALPAAGADAADVFDATDLAAMINADGTVNIDPEGIAVASDGGFWVASEGAGTVGEASRPVTSENLIFKTDAGGNIQQVIRLPEAVRALQVRFGFEGVAESDGKLVVAIQRAWGGEAGPRIGIYDLATASWTFAFYPLDAVASPNGGWVGLSDITALGNNQFMVVERDNQGGPDARIKRLYRIDLSGVADGGTLTKTLVRDLLASGDLSSGGAIVAEKIEGSALTADGRVLIINDNDGVDDNSGETRLLDLGQLF